MAEAVRDGAKGAGADVDLITASDFGASKVPMYDAIAFGCPAMGAENLEEGEFEPMFDALVKSLAGKRIALFGSYGWGDGEWMRNWETRCEEAGATLVHDSVICQEAPDADALAACGTLGASLTK
jgi:flavodoxin short chain